MFHMDDVNISKGALTPLSPADGLVGPKVVTMLQFSTSLVDIHTSVSANKTTAMDYILQACAGAVQKILFCVETMAKKENPGRKKSGCVMFFCLLLW